MKKFTILGGAALLALAGAALAQPPGGPDGRARPDRNADVTRQQVIERTDRVSPGSTPTMTAASPPRRRGRAASSAATRAARPACSTGSTSTITAASPARRWRRPMPSVSARRARAGQRGMPAVRRSRHAPRPQGPRHGGPGRPRRAAPRHARRAACSASRASSPASSCASARWPASTAADADRNGTLTAAERQAARGSDARSAWRERRPS